MANKKTISAILIITGTGLLLEHLFSYGGYDLLDWIGHEYYGIALILAGFLLSIKWKQWKEMKLWKLKNQFR